MKTVEKLLKIILKSWENEKIMIQLLLLLLYYQLYDGSSLFEILSIGINDELHALPGK